MSVMEETDGFVLVSKDGLGGGLEDDIVSVSSSRSSLCLVDDPSLEGLIVGEDEDAAAAVEPELQAPDPEAADAHEDAAPVPEPEQPAPSQPLEPTVAGPAATPAAEAVPKPQPKYVCAGCRSDVAARADTIWEGYMGANKAAYLFSKVLNTEPAAEPRKQQLSTGLFLLQDDQKYKEGATIVQQSLLQLVPETGP